MSGAGNDFILLDRLARQATAGRTGADIGKYVRRHVCRLCDRRLGIGADGLLLVKRGRIPSLSYFNADGSEAFCGNGARCAALWMYDQGWTRGNKGFSLAAGAGPLRARITTPGSAALLMPPVRDLRPGLKISVLGKSYTANYLNTGVPHAVIEVRNLENFPVLEVGRAMRRHSIFSPSGANVDFIRIRSGAINMRTYERGVEDETLACGTGAAAAALVGFLLGKCRPPVKIKVRSGEILKACFETDRGGKQYGDIWLEGPAQLIYTGEINI